MANINRTAKSGSDWTVNELAAYNIRVEFIHDASTFFGIPRLPDPVSVKPEEVLHAAEASQTTTDDGYILLRTLHLAMAIAPNEESGVVDFAAALFRACGYVTRGRVVRTRKDVPLLVCGENRHVQADVCILDDDDEILLLVQEDKCHLDESDPEPRLIAGAIAAFASNNNNNRMREKSPRTPSQEPLALASQQSKVIPGITLKGTSPIFYKIPITTDLVTAVQRGTYPQQETVVHAHVPALPRPARRWSEGMNPLDNRKIILSCYEAFKQLVN